MGKTKISISLSETSIDKALSDLGEYKADFIRKTEILKERIASELAHEAETGFNGAVLEDFTDGSQVMGNVDVSVDTRGDITVVVANGEDVVWIEFGAGVYHNGSPWTSPHPKGTELGLTIGSYGKGYGKKKAWGYFDGTELKVTHGTPASMPMAKAVTKICNDIVTIAREVFG